MWHTRYRYSTLKCCKVCHLGMALAWVSLRELLTLCLFLRKSKSFCGYSDMAECCIESHSRRVNLRQRRESYTPDTGEERKAWVYFRRVHLLKGRGINLPQTS